MGRSGARDCFWFVHQNDIKMLFYLYDDVSNNILKMFSPRLKMICRPYVRTIWSCTYANYFSSKWREISCIYNFQQFRCKYQRLLEIEVFFTPIGPQRWFLYPWSGTLTLEMIPLWYPSVDRGFYFSYLKVSMVNNYL